MSCHFSFSSLLYFFYTHGSQVRGILKILYYIKLSLSFSKCHNISVFFAFLDSGQFGKRSKLEESLIRLALVSEMSYHFDFLFVSLSPRVRHTVIEMHRIILGFTSFLYSRQSCTGSSQPKHRIIISVFSSLLSKSIILFSTFPVWAAWRQARV